jgi:hypothetical protein
MPLSEPTKNSFLVPNSVSSQTLAVSLMKPMHPPASRPRKRDLSAANQRVVYPPRESCTGYVSCRNRSALGISMCFSLRVMVPSIPEGGTKSRVETQIRVTIDLADACSISGDLSKYDRVGSWKWLKLPPGTATKKRTRKQGKIGSFYSFSV